MSLKLSTLVKQAGLLTAVLLVITLHTQLSVQAREEVGQEITPPTARVATQKQLLPGAPSSLVVEPLSAELTPSDMAQVLVGTGLTISNITYTGADVAAGHFSGGDGIIGFDSGVILTSGSVHNIVGPNQADAISQNNTEPGDADLTALSGFDTFDATVLEFDFVPDSNTVFFRFVFASDEYNEWVNSQYNDVFAFYVNGQNCATVEGSPVAVNTINYGNPHGTTPNSHPELYVNNDLSDGGGAIDTEMDGLTTVLTCSSAVNPDQVNHMKLAIADASDGIYDSAVFLEAKSLTGAPVIELTGLEVTQSIQNLENNIVMVSDKPTVVRAHVRSVSSAIFNVKARLIGRRNGNVLPESPLAPSNVGGNINVFTSPNRATLNDSFYFTLPQSWLNGTVEFEFTGLTHAADCQEHAGTDDDCMAQVTFENTPRPQIRLIGLRWTDGNGVVHDPDAADYAAVVQDIQAEYPIPSLDWDNPIELNVAGNPPNLNTVLQTVDNQRTLDGSSRIYYGLLVDHVSGGLGVAYRPGWAGVGYLRATDPTTAAHEIGHSLGRQHTLCDGGEAGTDPAFPNANGRISQAQTGDNALFGFHSATRQIFPPNTGDLLGYCRPRWASDHTYTQLRNAIVTRFPTLSARTNAMLNTGEPAILVSGVITPTEAVGRFDTTLQIEAPGPVPAPPSGPYTIRFENEAHNELASYSFAPNFIEDGTEPVAGFSLLLPWNAATSRIVLLHGDKQLAIREASGPAPDVSLISPSEGDIWGGETATISWTTTGRDEQQESLKYTVQYSTDGGATWLTLITGWPGTTYELSLDTLPGTDNAMVRVLAVPKDGFQTGQAINPGTFVVESHAPLPQIESPVDNNIYVEDQIIPLRGSAYDAEDGLLADEALQWSSDVDGPLGSGNALDISAMALSEGSHTISLTAEDSDGQTTTATITIQIYRDVPILPKRLLVDPTSLSLFTIEGSETPQTVMATFRNEGDGTIEWSAEIDQSWLTMTTTVGFTPADMILTVDPTGLPSGTHTGVVTVTGLESLDSPQMIEIELVVHEPVQADFSAAPIAGSSPVAVKFTNLSSGSYTSSEWDFGDGESSNAANPTHIYEAPGVYTVTLTVNGPGGTDVITKMEYVTVTPPILYLPAVMRP